jgi:hypothetical protein
MMGLATEGLALVTEGDVERGISRLDEAAAAALGGEFSEIWACGWCLCYMIYACEHRSGAPFEAARARIQLARALGVDRIEMADFRHLARTASDQFPAKRFGDGGGPRGGAELGEDVGYVAVDGVLGEHEPFGDLAIGVAFGNKAKDLTFALGKGRGLRGGLLPELGRKRIRSLRQRIPREPQHHSGTRGQRGLSGNMDPGRARDRRHSCLSPGCERVGYRAPGACSGRRRRPGQDSNLRHQP